jgi:hypothetical protein
MMTAEMLRDETSGTAHPESASGGAEGAREDGQGRRRRRRGGRGGGGDRNRPDRASRESSANEASPADAIESRAADLEHARGPEHESKEAPVHRSEPEHEPVTPTFTQAPAAPAFAPVAFREVSQHDEVQDESQPHRPQRRKKHGGDAEPAQQSQLQLVETQAEASATPADDDLPRRTKPRRRRAQAADNEPLKLVETQPGTQQPQDGPPTP